MDKNPYQHIFKFFSTCSVITSLFCMQVNIYTRGHKKKTKKSKYSCGSWEPPWDITRIGPNTPDQERLMGVGLIVGSSMNFLILPFVTSVQSDSEVSHPAPLPTHNWYYQPSTRGSGVRRGGCESLLYTRHYYSYRWRIYSIDTV